MLAATRSFPRWRKIRVAMGEPLTFSDERNDREGWESIAERTQKAVRELQSSNSPGLSSVPS
jgi:hypothetical protein